MFKRLLTFLCVAANVTSFAQVLIDENFDYANGSLLTANGYTQASAGTPSLTVTNATGNASSLTFTDYAASGVGGAVAMSANGQDVYRSFTAVSTGTVYASFLISVSAAQTGDYFFNLGKSNSTDYFARVFIRTATGGFNLGLSVNSGAATYASTVFPTGTTVLVVVKYEHIVGGSNDVVSLFAPNSATPPIAEGTPLVTLTAGTDAGFLSSYHLRQGSAAAGPTLIIDGVRVATDYESVLPLSLLSFSAQRSADVVKAYWKTAGEHAMSHMELQRSADGSLYETVATVAVANTADEHSYDAIDVRPLTGRSYYRLALVSQDGSVEYSKAVAVAAAKTGQSIFLQAIPNPAGRSFSLVHSVAAADARILVYSVDGRLLTVRQPAVGSSATDMTSLELPAGCYIAIFESEGAKATTRFVK